MGSSSLGQIGQFLQSSGDGAPERMNLLVYKNGLVDLYKLCYFPLCY